MKKNKINRRSFIKKAAIPLIGAASISSFNVHASNINELSMVTSWPENFPGIGLGANRLAKRIEKLSNNKIKVNVYSAGELVLPLEFLMLFHLALLICIILLNFIGVEKTRLILFLPQFPLV